MVQASRSHSGDETMVSNCVPNYFKLEQELKNDTKLQFNLHRLFYPPNSHPPYSIEVVYQMRDANGSITRVSTNPNCKKQLWLWVSSPIFIFIRPEHLARISLYTLNYFDKWKPQRIFITISEPCRNEMILLLKQLTAQVSACTAM